MRNVREFVMGNTWLDIKMVCRTNLEATLWRYPIETVSGSEGGYERTYQGSSILLQWLMKLPPDELARTGGRMVVQRPERLVA